MEQKFLDQLERWNEEGQYQHIIDALEALPRQELTARLASDLARAYNNLAQPQDKHLFHRAVRLLEAGEEELGDDHCWNFRMAYAYYYLDQEGLARYYFRRALDARPGDRDTQEFIVHCDKRLALPLSAKPFRLRVREGWEAFLAGEEELRRLMDQKDQAAVGDELIAKCGRLLSAAFEDVCFELGHNGEKYELILTPEGDWAKLFQLVYFQRRAPREVLERWNIQVGRTRSANFGLRMYGQDISAADAQVWVERLEGTQVELSVYCEKLLPLMEENENRAYGLMAILLDQTIGELAAMRYVDRLELLTAPEAGDSVGLDRLAAYLEQELDPEGWPQSADPEQACQRYTAYQAKPTQEEEWSLRQDVYVGVSCCMPILNCYYRGDDSVMDAFHRDGVVPGFVYYPLEGIDKQEILNLRDSLEQAILERAGEEAALFIGGATGTAYGYLDFIAWDLKAVLDAAVEALAAAPMKWAAFHTFRWDAAGIALKREEERV